MTHMDDLSPILFAIALHVIVFAFIFRQLGPYQLDMIHARTFPTDANGGAFTSSAPHAFLPICNACSPLAARVAYAMFMTFLASMVSALTVAGLILVWEGGHSVLDNGDVHILL
jgi:hypothetical protein